MRFGEKLKILRENKGLTQEQLASSFNVSRSLIARYEAGSAYPDVDFVNQLAGFFNVEFEDLAGDDIEVKVPYSFVRIYMIIHNIMFFLGVFISLSFLIVGFIPFFKTTSNGKDISYSVITGNIFVHSYVGIVAYVLCVAHVALLIVWFIKKDYQKKMVISLFTDILFFATATLIFFACTVGINISI